MLLATVHSEPPRSRMLHLLFPFILPPKDTQVKDEEAEFLRGDGTHPKPQSYLMAEWTQLTGKPTFFFALSAWYPVTKCHKNLRTGNEDGNIQVGPLPVGAEPSRH